MDKLTDPTYVMLLAGAYLLGAVPFGWLVGRARGLDVRRQGSGNIGATNILRSVGRGPALVTLCLDIAKGFLPVLGARVVFPAAGPAVIAVGIAAIAGHTCSIFLRFRGGKGVATSLGVVLGLAPQAALAAALAWLLVYLASRSVSLASLAAALALPALFRIFHPGEKALFLFGLALTAGVFFFHRANIGRLARGEEPTTVPWKK